MDRDREPLGAHEWLSLPSVEVRHLDPSAAHPAISIICVQDEDEPLPGLRQAILKERPRMVVVYTTGPRFRSFLEGKRQVKQAWCYIAAFDNWKDATDALESGLRGASSRPNSASGTTLSD